MDVGSCLRGKSAFTTHQNSLISYGEFYGKTYGSAKIPPLSNGHKNTQLSIFQKNCVI